MEIRSPRPTEWPALLEFLDQNLRPQTEWSIRQEYPAVFSESNRVNLRVVVDNEKVVAHAAIKYHLIKTIVGVFKVAAIGSVVTAPERRNQGLSQQVLQDCITSSQMAGADFAILWTDLYDFYRKLDFELAGHEVSLILNDPLGIPVADGYKVLKSSRVAPESISRIYAQHTVGTIRSPDDIRRFLEIPGSEVYTLWSPQQELKAYAVEGKGIDLHGYIHEWGGGVNELLQLFSFIQEDQKKSIVVISPTTATNLIQRLRGLGCSYNDGFLGMIRILNHEGLFQKIHRHAKSLGIQDLVLEKRESEYVLGRGQNLTTTQDVKELTRILFGPYDFRDSVSILNPVLPIPMWIWGWDSV
jgi:predicted N-acetyltransferase YhbS